jgi:hypothetical protein
MRKDLYRIGKEKGLFAGEEVWNIPDYYLTFIIIILLYVQEKDKQ